MSTYTQISAFAHILNDYLNANKLTQKEVRKLVKTIVDPTTNDDEYDLAVETIYWALYHEPIK